MIKKITVLSLLSIGVLASIVVPSYSYYCSTIDLSNGMVTGTTIESQVAEAHSFVTGVNSIFEANETNDLSSYFEATGWTLNSNYVVTSSTSEKTSTALNAVLTSQEGNTLAENYSYVIEYLGTNDVADTTETSGSIFNRTTKTTSTNSYSYCIYYTPINILSLDEGQSIKFVLKAMVTYNYYTITTKLSFLGINISTETTNEFKAVIDSENKGKSTVIQYATDNGENYYKSINLTNWETNI